MKIAVIVRGGMVEEVRADSPNVELQIIDMDTQDQDDQDAAEACWEEAQQLPHLIETVAVNESCSFVPRDEHSITKESF